MSKDESSYQRAYQIKANIKDKSRQHIPVSIKMQKCWSKHIYGSKIPILVTSLCSQTAFHTLWYQTTLLKFLKMVLVCAKLPQCWSSPDNISMISNVTMIYWSFGGRMSIWGVQSLNIQSFFPTHFIIHWTKISNSNNIPLHTKPLYDLFMLKFRLGFVQI